MMEIKLNRVFVRSSKTLRLSIFTIVFVFLAASQAYSQLTIKPTTWNVIGLDSNKVTDGPNKFPVGVEVCNLSGTAINNVTGSFFWDSSNSYINLESISSSANIGSLAAGNCTGIYFIVVITRDKNAYNTARSFHISVSGDGAGTVSTPTPRELYVEKLVSQNRNSLISVIGPSSVYVGGTYDFTLNATTATNGYEQLEAFLPFSSSIFEVKKITTTYTAPAGGTNDKFYADACGWDNIPGSVSYRSCIGPNQYSGGKAGGTISTTYTVKVLSLGTATLSALIYDYSGSSYHYNSDYGAQTVTVVSQYPPDLTLSKSHIGNFTAGTSGAYTFTVRNAGGDASSGNITVTDTLPAGLTVNSGGAGVVSVSGTNAANWTCNSNSSSPQTISCTSSASIPTSGTSIFNISVNVSLNTSIGTNSITNTASVSGGNEFNTSNNTASDPTTVLSPDLTISKSHTGNFVRGATGLYTLTVTNTGTTSTNGTITVSDTLPTGLKVNGGSSGTLTIGGTNAANWTCSSNAATPQIITCTSSTVISNTSGSNTSIFNLSINVASNAAASITNNVAVSGGNEATANNGNNTASDPTTTEAPVAPNIELVKSCPSPSNCISAPQFPGTDITYKIQFTNTGGSGASNLRLIDGIPSNMDYKLGSAAANAGTSGLIFVIEFSSDYDPLNPNSATWTYTPASAGGGASAGYDRLVKAIRWRVTAGTLSNISPNNTGDIGFIAKIR